MFVNIVVCKWWGKWISCSNTLPKCAKMWELLLRTRRKAPKANKRECQKHRKNWQRKVVSRIAKTSGLYSHVAKASTRKKIWSSIMEVSFSDSGDFLAFLHSTGKCATSWTVYNQSIFVMTRFFYIKKHMLVINNQAYFCWKFSCPRASTQSTKGVL